jgi:hypothetical protein
VWWPGLKNSPIVTHACRKRRLKWVPSVWGYSWATLSLGVINTEPGPPGPGLGAGLTIHPRKKVIVTNPQKGRPGLVLGCRAMWWWPWKCVSVKFTFVCAFWDKRGTKIHLKLKSRNNQCRWIRAFWDIAPYSLVEVNRRFRGLYCLHHQGDYFIRLLMEAVRISETSVYYNETARRYIPEGCNLHTRHRENLKSHKSV